MLVSIYGQLEFGDMGSLRDWLSAHDRAHRTITRTLQAQGRPIQPVLLDTADVDNDWFGQHGVAHETLAGFIMPDTVAASPMMMSNLADWAGEDAFYNWHQMHDRLHSRINQALGITA